MPDDTVTARRLHVERLIARGGEMSLDDARSLLARATAAPAPETPLPVLFILLTAIAAFCVGWLAGVIS